MTTDLAQSTWTEKVAGKTTSIAVRWSTDEDPGAAIVVVASPTHNIEDEVRISLSTPYARLIRDSLSEAIAEIEAAQVVDQ